MAGFLHMAYMDWWIEPKHNRELQELTHKLVEQCNTQKRLTEEATNDLLKKTSDLTAKLNAYKLRLKSQPVPATQPTTGNDDSPSFGEYVGQRRYDAWLEYFADAEKYRLQLISCQSFVTKVWAQ